MQQETETALIFSGQRYFKAAHLSDFINIWYQYFPNEIHVQNNPNYPGRFCKFLKNRIKNLKTIISSLLRIPEK